MLALPASTRDLTTVPGEHSVFRVGRHPALDGLTRTSRPSRALAIGSVAHPWPAIYHRCEIGPQ